MQNLSDIAPYVALAFLFFVGLGLGASTTFDDVRSAFRKPGAVAVGFLSQYLFMPISAYLFSLAFQFDTPVAIGVILLGCSPGGVASNLFTFWTHGDVALSITMSFLSTCAAFALMPLWVFLLLRLALGGGDDESTDVDWINMAISVLTIAVPTSFGLYIRRANTVRRVAGKFIWQWMELGASVVGMLFVCVGVGGAFMAYGNVFADVPWRVWIVSIVFMPLGCSFGYLVSRVCGMSLRDCRTISIETGMQNFGFTVAIVQLSFSDNPEIEKRALFFPLVYAVSTGFWLPTMFIFFRYYLMPRDKEWNKKVTETLEKQNNSDHVSTSGTLALSGTSELSRASAVIP